MAQDYLKRYMWLIALITRRGPITLSEINREWRNCSYNDTGEDIPERTFFNHKSAIQEMFGIEIKSKRGIGYCIEEDEDLGIEGVRNWMIQSLTLNNIINGIGTDIRSRIIFENAPSCQKHLTPIISAIKEGKAVELTYQSFNRTVPNTFLAYPFCVKLFRQRWYLLASSEGYKQPKIYALDRVHEVQESTVSFTPPANFDAQNFFDDYFGIIIGERKAQLVKLKVDADQVKYLRSLPLHHSQKETECTEEYSVFTYRIVPTFDFRKEILSYGDSVEVLEPASFRTEVQTITRNTANRYL